MTDLAEQKQRNLRSRDDWTRYAHHRQKVTECLLNAAKAGSTLAVLGAGNCNDLDLSQLASHFSSVHLADLDEGAMKWGLEQQGSPSGITCHVADLGGLMGAASPTTVSPTRPWSAPFDVCVSVCLLSQIVEAASQRKTDVQQWIDASVRAHTDLLAGTIADDGTAILITDFLSSDTCRAITPAATASELERTLRQAFVQGNFFRGLHPGQLRQRMQESMAARGNAQIQLSTPWIWEHGARNYAVVALVATNEGQVTV